MNILLLYDKRSTFTNTVFDHLTAFVRYSRHRHCFLHGGEDYGIDVDAFDAVVIHYSARVAFNFLPPPLFARIAAFRGVKALFVQDEYDLTENTRRTIGELGVGVVFTVVPEAHRELVYPAARFPGVRFVTTLTGFVPPDIPAPESLPAIASRPLDIAYRGRALPFWYGDLGQEKQQIGVGMRAEAEKRGVPCDIEWEEGRRIYGQGWTSFLLSSKTTLGSESGCNRFDDDGGLRRAVTDLQARSPGIAYAEARAALWGDSPETPIMNQISPRVFESIALKTGLILFDGGYSGVLTPDVHYIPLRKDFANADEVFRRLADTAGVQRMVDRAYADIVASGRYSYAAFVAGYDAEIEAAAAGRQPGRGLAARRSAQLTDGPLRYQPKRLFRMLSAGWAAVPEPVRARLRPIASRTRKLLDP